MRKAIKLALAVFLIAAFLGASVFLLTDGRGGKDPDWRTAGGTAGRGVPASGSTGASSGSMPSFPPFGAGGFETGGYGTAALFTGPIADRGSIEQVREAFATRARRGIADRLAELETIPRDAADPSFRRLRVQATIVFLLMYEGKFAEAAEWTERACGRTRAPAELRANLEALLGVIHLRRGETENCLDCRGPSSCIFPIAAEAVHQQPSGSRAAIGHFTTYLRQRPEDLGVRWLLNVAYMTLGEYPEKVPRGVADPAGAVPVAAGHRPVRERARRGGAERAGPEHGRGEHLRRLHRRRSAGRLHHVVRRRSGGVAVRQPGRRDVRGPLRIGRTQGAGRWRSMPRRPTTTTTAGWT